MPELEYVVRDIIALNECTIMPVFQFGSTDMVRTHAKESPLRWAISWLGVRHEPSRDIRMCFANH